jgi:Na+-driven multidrug efflux pump
MTITHFFSLRLLARNQEKPIMISLIAAILVLVIFTSATIARWSVLGVVWGLLLAESIQAGILLFYWRKQNSS